MKLDEIERLLTDEEWVTPSRRFHSAVMAAVEDEAAAQERLRFPWLRALPGIVAMIAALVVAIRQGIASLNDPAVTGMLAEPLRQVAMLASGSGFNWIVLGLSVAIVSVPLSLSLVRIAPAAATR